MIQYRKFPNNSSPVENNEDYFMLTWNSGRRKNREKEVKNSGINRPTTASADGFASLCLVRCH